MDRHPMTPIGYETLKAELKHLKTVERPAISNAIAVARDHGDLSENAEYHAAKEKQGFIEGRLKEIDIKICKAKVIDPTKLSGDKVMFGATVTYVDCNTDEEKTWQLVGDDESDVKLGKISYFAPIAKALIGKSLGDVIEFRSPKGMTELEIIKVQYI